jgi:hypothetical protein
LEFVLTNLDPGNAVSDISFNDDLSATLSGLTATDELFNDCTGDIGLGGNVSFTNGLLDAGMSCTIRLTLLLPADVGGDFENTTSEVTGQIGGLPVAGTPATDTLSIGVLTFTKAFSDTVNPGETVDLIFTIRNLSTTETISEIGFTDELSDVIVGLAATDLPKVGVCGGTSELAGSSLLTFAGGTLLPSGSCTFQTTLHVPGGAWAGDYPNRTSVLTASRVPAAPPAIATLQITGPRQADINGDGCIDRTDLSLLNALIRSGSATVPAHDLNGDGVVNAADQRTLVGEFDNPLGAPCAP